MTHLKVSSKGSVKDVLSMASPQLKPSDTRGSRSALTHPPLPLSIGRNQSLAPAGPCPRENTFLSKTIFYPGGSDGKESACSAGDPGSIPGSRRFPGEGKGYPLQYSCLENPHGQRSLAGYSPWGRKESDMTE